MLFVVNPAFKSGVAWVLQIGQNYGLSPLHGDRGRVKAESDFAHLTLNVTIIVAVVSASASILAAALTFYLTKRHELAVQLRHEKLNHYKVLLAAISDLAVDGTNKTDANMRFALAVNTIGLAAPQYVISALMAFHDEVKYTNPCKSDERHDRLLNELLLAIRKDIGLAKGDNAGTFKFHLIGVAPQSGSQQLTPVKRK